MVGFITVDGPDHGWKPSKYSLFCLAHFEESCFEESCFEEDVSYHIVGQDPHKRRQC